MFEFGPFFAVFNLADWFDFLPWEGLAPLVLLLCWWIGAKPFSTRLFKRRPLAAHLLIVWLPGLLFVSYEYWQSNQCRLTVTNLSGHDVNDIMAIMGEVQVPSVGPLENGKHKTIILLCPVSEAGLQIRFVGKEGRVVTGGNGYIEPGYSGHWGIGPGDEVLDLPSKIHAAIRQRDR